MMEKQRRPQFRREPEVLADPKPLCTLVLKKLFPYGNVVNIPLQEYYSIGLILLWRCRTLGKLMVIPITCNFHWAVSVNR